MKSFCPAFYKKLVAEGSTGPNRHKARTVRSAPGDPRQDGRKNTFTNLDAHPANTCLRRQTFEKV